MAYVFFLIHVDGSIGLLYLYVQFFFEHDKRIDIRQYCWCGFLSDFFISDNSHDIGSSEDSSYISVLE
jgi:hypothetical protein